MARKVVQTELEDNEYLLLKKTVKKKGISIKDGVREAVHQWVATQIPLSEDPLFNVEPVMTGVKTDSSRLDDALYKEKQG
ncbi:hypothetical protein JXL21_12140 [Candidatus Bathyarchaeota archaeon]|nr:hypothetical protein [Candidatus Bathyarchaeota archaeon]